MLKITRKNHLVKINFKITWYKKINLIRINKRVNIFMQNLGEPTIVTYINANKINFQHNE